MAVPGPLITGTVTYAVAGAILLALALVSRATGMMSKDNVA